jgi:hypothetical protein
MIARIVSPVTGKEIEVPFQGGVLDAQAFFNPLGIKVISTTWWKRDWEYKDDEN